MATTVKTTSAQAISRIIGSTGIRKSVTGTTRIRGWHKSTEGYVVTSTENFIYIAYIAGDWNVENFATIYADAIAKITEALTSKGYKVEEASGFQRDLKIAKVSA